MRRSMPAEPEKTCARGTEIQLVLMYAIKEKLIQANDIWNCDKERWQESQSGGCLVNNPYQ